MRGRLAGLVLGGLAAGSLAAQEPPAIGIIDTYGLTRLSREAVIQASGLHPGDSIPSDTASLTARLRAVPGVRAASLNAVCCEDGRAIIYIGIVESDARLPGWNPAPAGASALPDSIRRLGEAFEEALWDALLHNDAGEDQSAGHALMHYPAARAIQERFIPIAAAELPLLRDVLRSSASAGDRALAVQILGYAPDKPAVVPDLVRATRDPDGGVRNNAMRALWVMAEASTPVPVPPDAFIPLLNSPEWTDRNKASMTLAGITRRRDPALLAALEAARPALLEMAHWKSLGHAFAALVILGRMRGLPEEEIAEALARGDREAILGRGQ